MTKLTFYRLIIAGLLISNILLIVFFFYTPQHKPFNPDTPRNTIINRLHFNKNQVAEYDLLIREHRKQISIKDAQIRQLKNELYALLPADNTPSKKDSLIEQLAQKQKDIETIHYTHFSDIKKICKTDQLKDYNKLVLEISSIFNHPPKPKK